MMGVGNFGKGKHLRLDGGLSSAMVNKVSNKDKAVTVCKNCMHYIYEEEPTTWQRQPRMGLVHSGCAETVVGDA